MKASAIIIVILSLILWVAGFYFGYIGNIYYFGKNIFKNWIYGSVVTIPTDSGITTIKTGEYAFNLLSQIDIPENITKIEARAFTGNILTSITICANVDLAGDAIGNGFEAFYADNKKNAGTYTRNDKNSKQWISWFGDYSYFRAVNNIIISGYRGTGSEAVIPAEVYGDVITHIGKNAFYNAGLTDVTFPTSVTTIEEAAFSANRLTRVTIPNNVRNIGVDAFAGNPITRVSLGANVTLGSTDDNHGILGQATGFNSAYRTANNSSAGVYTRRSVESTAWGRTAR